MLKDNIFMYYFLKVKEQFISLHLIYIKHFMANNILLISWISEAYWSYNYLLVIILLLIISILLYRIRKLQKTIKKTNHSYRFSFDILDNLPFPIFVKDITNDFRYYYWNKESAAQSGISSEEAIGHTDYEIYGEERGEKYRHIDKELIQAGKVYRKEEKYTTPDGITHDTIAVKSIISWEGEKKWLLATRWDITQLKNYERELVAAKEELEKALKKQKLALKSIDFGLIYIDKNYRVQWEETRQIASLVKGRRYIPGKICYQTSALRNEPCGQCAFKKAIEQGKIIRHTIRVDNVDFEVTATPVFGDEKETEIIGGLLRFENITEKLKMDKMLQEAKEKAEESNRLKSAFLANMSHEIRTPLNAIVGFSSLLAETDEAELRHVYMSLVQENNELLLNLISDILDISKIEAGMIDLVMGRVDVPQLCREVIATFSHKKRDTAVELRFDENSPQIVIDADKNRIMQVLSNFLTNALKFTTKGSITLSYSLEDESQVRFCVTDTGKGIPDEQKHEIFNRFVKLDSFVQGAGLGLSICQSLVNRMGGKIGVESREGEGSCFWFTHPYVPGA